MKRPVPFHSNAVWPPARLVISFLLIYGLVSVCLWLVSLPWPAPDQEEDGAMDIQRIQSAILLGAAGLLGIFRVLRFHPACNRAYAGWLRMAPWTAEKPLPLGPVHLVWQDVAVLAFLSGIAKWHAGVSFFSPLIVFILAYLGSLTVLLAMTRTWPHFIVLGFLWPALLLPKAEGLPGIAILVCIAAIAWLGFWKSLRVFPNGFPASDPSARRGSLLQAEIRVPLLGVQAVQTLGWPLAALSPKLVSTPISLRQSIVVSALIAWWAFCILETTRSGPLPEMLLLVAIVSVVIRLVTYLGRVCAPVSYWGRLALGRPVLPAYDKVFVTPLAALALAIAGGMLIKHSGAAYSPIQSALVGLVLFVLFSGGPTLNQWLLTGHHRFRPPPVSSKTAVRKI